MSECCDNIKSGVVISVRGHTLRVRDDDGKVHIVRVAPGNRVPQLDERVHFDCEQLVAITTPVVRSKAMPRKRAVVGRKPLGRKRKLFGPVGLLYFDTSRRSQYIDYDNPLDDTYLTLSVSFLIVDELFKNTHTLVASLKAMPEAIVGMDSSVGIHLGTALDGRASFYYRGVDLRTSSDAVSRIDGSALFLEDDYVQYAILNSTGLSHERTILLRYGDDLGEGFGIRGRLVLSDAYEVGSPKRSSCECIACGGNQYKTRSSYSREREGYALAIGIDYSNGTHTVEEYRSFGLVVTIDSATCTTTTDSKHIVAANNWLRSFNDEERAYRVAGNVDRYGSSSIYTYIEDYCTRNIVKMRCCTPENQDSCAPASCDDTYRETCTARDDIVLAANDPDGELLLRGDGFDILNTRFGYCVTAKSVSNEVYACFPRGRTAIDFTEALYPGTYYHAGGAITRKYPRMRDFDSLDANIMWVAPATWAPPAGDFWFSGFLYTPIVGVAFDVDGARRALEESSGDVSGTDYSFIYDAIPTSETMRFFTGEPVKGLVVPICPTCAYPGTSYGEGEPWRTHVYFYGNDSTYHWLDSYTGTTFENARRGEEWLAMPSEAGDVWVVIGEPPRIYYDWQASGQNMPDRVVGMVQLYPPGFDKITVLWLRNYESAHKIGLHPGSYAYYARLPRTIWLDEAKPLANRIRRRGTVCANPYWHWWCESL